MTRLNRRILIFQELVIKPQEYCFVVRNLTVSYSFVIQGKIIATNGLRIASAMCRPISAILKDISPDGELTRVAGASLLASKSARVKDGMVPRTLLTRTHRGLRYFKFLIRQQAAVKR